MQRSFSGERRTELLRAMSEQEHELLVIGGGITGAGIALDAQTRGIRTALVEMQDFAAGTSSRSTKLVHGGLRYLKQLEIGVVAEVGRERAIVYENGPHVTTPERMLLPIYEGGTFGKLATSLGLRVYDYLAGVKKSERRQMLGVAQTVAKEPLLKPEGLLGGGYYVEYRTDDARLTIEVLKRAVEYGAMAVNYAKVERFLYENGRTSGVHVTDRLSGKTYTIQAGHIVNAAGPWVDELRDKDNSKQGKTLHLTKGVHLVFSGRRFPLRQAIYFDTSDGRMVFAIPRDGRTYVGTTDTDYRGDIANPRMTETDRSYLLRAVNDMFPGLALAEADVESSWAGLRPLIHQAGKGPSDISRKDEIFVSDSGLISMAGGKLTGYRKMAETAVDLVSRRLEADGRPSVDPCRTKSLPISGGDVGGSGQWEGYKRERMEEGRSLGLPGDEAERLVQRYGSNIGLVFTRMAKDRSPEEAAFDLPAGLLASLDYAIDSEMAALPIDFFIRRTGALFFDRHWVCLWKDQVVSYMAYRYGWDPEQTRERAEELNRQLEAAVVPLK